MSNAAIPESAVRRRQGEPGQFLTPAPLASFMASSFEPLPNVVRRWVPGLARERLPTCAAHIVAHNPSA